MRGYIAAGLFALTLAVPANGQGVPTIDTTSLAKLVEQLAEAKLQLEEQIKQNLKLDEQTKQMIQQVMLLKQQLDAMKDGFSLADLGFDPKNFLKEMMPDFSDMTKSVDAARMGDWTQVLAGGDKLGGGTVTAHVDKAFKSAGLTREQVDTLAKSEDAGAARIGQSANVNVFMSVAAESSAEAAKESLIRLNGFVEQIGASENLKQAIDLNTRVTAELGIGLANIWSMEAAQTVSLGNMGVMDAATAAEEEKYLRTKLED